MSAQLWLAQVGPAEDQAWQAAFEPRLSVSERARLGRFGRPLRRVQFLAAHALARIAVAARAGGTPAGVRVACDADGRPRIDGAPGWRLSLAHSGRWAAALVDFDPGAATPIGVDIEVRRPERDIESIVAALGARAVSRDDAYRRWVLYEAAQKAGGREAGWAATWSDLALAVVGVATPPGLWRAELFDAASAVRAAVPAPIAWTAGSFEGALG